MAGTERTPPALFTAATGDLIQARFSALASAAVRLSVRFGEALLRLSYRRKRVVMLVADSSMLSLAVWGALTVQTMSGTPLDPASVIWLIAAVVTITIPIFVWLGLYRTVIHYLGEQAILAVVQAVMLSAILLAAVIAIAGVGDASITTAIVYCFFALSLIGGSRLAMRIFFGTVASGVRKHVVVYGAGDSGVQLVKALAFSHDYRPVAFVDDDKTLQRRLVHGLSVYEPRQLPALILKLGLSHVLLAMPSISPARRAEILTDLDALPIHVKTVPGLSDLVSGKARFHDIRDVDIEDIFDRKSVRPDQALAEVCMRGKVVLITGAGGSIGSQLCRRVLQLEPKQLILFEQSEFHLYQIEMELSAASRREGLSVSLVPLLGSVQDRKRLEEVISRFEADTVYHAAAYKHVPIVEHNMIEGARNNVLGSWHVAAAAIAAGVETCVLISTDKAVRPTSVMGASKRIAEMIFQGMGAEALGTRFSIVRLGNVVGSSGSVIPLFHDQIRRGGPVTVTDSRATRYFMTVSEAAELIIQAGAMGNRGEIFVLDMGEPIRIDDLARKMIRLGGLTVKGPDNPDGDVAIEYIGLRPGEKLHEELLIGNNVEPTAHPKIMCAIEDYSSPQQIQPLLRLLNELCAKHDCEAIRKVFLRAVDGYAPSGPLMDRLWLQQSESLHQSGPRRLDELSNNRWKKDQVKVEELPVAVRAMGAVIPTKARQTTRSASERVVRRR